MSDQIVTAFAGALAAQQITLAVYAVGHVVVGESIANGVRTHVAFCGRCYWSTRQQHSEDLAREIADHMRVCRDD